MKIIKWILILILGFFFASCVTLKRCNKKFPPEVIVKDSIVYKTNTVYKDTTIFIQLPPDTVFSVKDSLVEVYIDKETGLINSDTSVLANDFATAYAWVIDSKLKQMLVQNDSLMEFKLDSAVRVTNDYWEKYHSEVILKPVYAVHWYDRVARVIASIFILALLVLIAIKVIKAYVKPF